MNWFARRVEATVRQFELLLYSPDTSITQYVNVGRRLREERKAYVAPTRQATLAQTCGRLTHHLLRTVFARVFLCP
jgi:hypothetical protein